MLSAFERDRVAADRAHVFGGADAVARIGIEWVRRLPRHFRVREAPVNADRIGFQPAIDESIDAQMPRHRTLFIVVAKRLQRPGIIDRPQHGECAVSGARGMQIQQHVMLREQGAQPIRGMVFKIARTVGRT